MTKAKALAQLGDTIPHRSGDWIDLEYIDTDVILDGTFTAHDRLAIMAIRDWLEPVGGKTLYEFTE